MSRQNRPKYSKVKKKCKKSNCLHHGELLSKATLCPSLCSLYCLPSHQDANQPAKKEKQHQNSNFDIEPASHYSFKRTHAAHYANPIHKKSQKQANNLAKCVSGPITGEL